jgi:hypothetical protein
MSLKIEINFDEAQLAKIMQIPLLMRLGPSERVLKAMSKPVIEKAKAIAPSSKTTRSSFNPKTGRVDNRTNRQKMGKNATKEFIGREANSRDDSGKHIGVKFLRNNRGGLLIIGGKSPKANKQNYDAGKERKVFYWGRDAGITKRIEPKDRFMQKAYDETRTAQISAGNAQLEKELKELKIG